PALADVWSGPGQHSNGVQGGRAIALLNALVGSYDRTGTMVIPNKAGGKHAAVHPDAVAEVGLKQPRFDELSRYPLGHDSGVYTQCFANLAEDTGPYRPKMAVSIFQNLMMSVPGNQNVAKALAKLETFVAIDTLLSETAMMADYVLPGTNYLERYDLQGHWVTWPALGLRQPVIKPLFGQPAEYEVVVELGRRLGLKEKDGKEFFKAGPVSGAPVENLTAWYEEYLSDQAKNGSPKMALAELKALPGAVWVDRKGTKYEKYAEEIPLEQVKTAFFDGDPKKEGTAVYDKPKDQKGKRIGTVIGGKPVRGFGTPSGKVEFVSTWLAKKTDADGKPVDPLPGYAPRDWQPSKEYPLFWINWKEANHTHTRTQNNPWLLDIKPDNPMIINPATAARYGIKDGDEVWVESQYGRVKAKARVTTRIHPEVVGVQHGFGHTALGRLAKGRGTSDSALRPTKSDPLSGQALHKEACVRLGRA
ncbi:MAG: molybdopterin-dependent oxidoreductase, partial [Candidatus Rokubacteria bacterium]|nr:molybdopterin-dependent oxidoreductase [Candidatus Rokubacteria bacterium]